MKHLFWLDLTIGIAFGVVTGGGVLHLMSGNKWMAAFDVGVASFMLVLQFATSRYALREVSAHLQTMTVILAASHCRRTVGGIPIYPPTLKDGP